MTLEPTAAQQARRCQMDQLHGSDPEKWQSLQETDTQARNELIEQLMKDEVEERKTKFLPVQDQLRYVERFDDSSVRSWIELHIDDLLGF